MSLTLLASNNASTVLASSINASATTLTVNTGAGSLFPSPVAGTSFFKLTLIDAATGQLTEIVHVTARTGDVMTIERAQEGTAARVWSANDIAANMMTAGTLSYILGSFQPLDATLTALAALIGAADKLPYFNGPDTAALTALTSVGRDIIGKSSTADVLTYLGLGSLKYGAPLIGQLIEWPLQQMPHEIWTDMGQEYIPYIAQSFDPVKYPLLSQLHPTNVLPADMRGYVARGWDNGRGVDTGRALMSAQEDAIRDITGSFYGRTDSAGPATGAFTNGTPSQTMGNTASLGIGPIYFKASNVVATAAENRSKNVAWNFIVRAK
ncbi:TPA: hypothetical protein R4S64_001946 [Kluyvera georgiana]|nr:hypothetical protein [Kluyvera georgiana]